MTLPPLAPRALVLAALAALLGACHSDRAATGSIYPTDYRTRHPIVLADGSRSLDVFVTGTGHLDPRQAADIDAFLLEYRRYGRGSLLVELPRGVAPGLAAGIERTAAAIRRLGAENAVPARGMAFSGYAVAAPDLASPIRLSFRRMEARVADRCGLWPQDLGENSPIANFRNEPSWNLGCATQSALAAQVADPVDLVRGRPEGRIDTTRRVKDIGQLRDGKDPSTTWRQDGKSDVKSQIGN
ncbi:CpaD family pilus assembly protein [uncultured Methylobacterium sp.]|uniref:CpaD family pilus assembly protein n=1 Tax=uncultured Methylobacterium sp. TaxID=157278 RepID=UPI0035C986A6